MIKVLYTIAIGLLFAGFVGLGFAAFYPEPKSPEYPAELQTLKNFDELTSDERAARDEADKKFRAESKVFEEKINNYNRNLSISLIIASLIILAGSILGLGKLEVIGDGLTLGGVFTLFYGLGRMMVGGDEKIRFFAVALGLAVLIALTWWKFAKRSESAPRAQS